MSRGRGRGFMWSFCVLLGGFCVYRLFFFFQSLSKNASLAAGCRRGMPRWVWLQSEGLESQEMPSCNCITPALRSSALSRLSPCTVRGWLSNAAHSVLSSAKLSMCIPTNPVCCSSAGQAAACTIPQTAGTPLYSKRLPLLLSCCAPVHKTKTQTTSKLLGCGEGFLDKSYSRDETGLLLLGHGDVTAECAQGTKSMVLGENCQGGLWQCQQLSWCCSCLLPGKHSPVGPG